MDHTTEQSHIISLANATKDNLLIQAYAGCGKTSTLEMIEHAVDVKPVLYLVFNKRNAEEAEERMLSTTTVRTFNSLGHRIWQKACAKNLALSPRKSQEVLRSIIAEAPKSTQGLIWDSFWDIIHAVALAKALGYVPEGKFPTAARLITRGAFHASLDETPDDLTSDLIDATLVASIKASYAGSIDYNDQIYMPALFGGTFPRFPLVFVDEAQDLSPVNHAMLEKLVKTGQRLIAVGDEAQSIYAFRGAKLGGIAEIQRHYRSTSVPLSVSFRCPRAIVEHSRWRVPNFKWIKDGGHVDILQSLDSGAIDDNSSIICRNNAPLFRCALNLLSNGRSVSVAGSDIGPKLLGLMRKLGPESLNKASVLSAIADWEADRLEKASTSASDMAACMKVFAEHGSTLGQAISYAEHLFSQKGKIRLLTGHKAKGLEFETVYHLDPDLCRDDDQDRNLRYVITTRSMNNLYEVNSRDIQW